MKSLRILCYFLWVVAISAIAFLCSSQAQDTAPVPGVMQTFRGHEEAVYAVALSPDGKLLLTGSFDRSIRLWDVATGKEVRTYGGPTGHQNLVLSVAFAPDGLTFASAGSDNTAKIWDVPQRNALKETALAAPVTAVGISVEGKLHAAGGKDGIIRLWNPADPKIAFTLTGHTAAVSGLALTPNSQLLVSVGADQTLRFWDAVKGQPLAAVVAHPSPITGLALAANGNTAYTTGEDGTIRFWQLPPTPSKSIAGHGDAITCMAIADANNVATGCADKTIRVLSIENGQIAKTFPAPAPISAILLSGNTIAAGTTAGEILVIDRNSGKTIYQAKAHAQAVTSISLNPQTGQAITTGAEGGAKTWTLAKNESKPLPLPGKPILATVSPDGKQIAVVDADKSVKLCQLADGKEIRPFGKVSATPQALTASRDFALVAAASGNEVRVWNVADGKEVAVIVHPPEVHSIAFDAEKKRVITGGADKLARIWELPSGKFLEAVALGGAVRTVAFHPAQPAQIIAGAADKSVLVHRLMHQRTIQASDKPIRAVSLMPSGSVLVAGDDGAAKIWNIGSGQMERAFAGSKDPLLAVAASRNGALVATASADKSIRLYNANDAALIGTFQGGVVHSLQFHSNNTSLAGSGPDKTVTFWSVAFQPGNPLPPEFGKVSQSLAHPAPVPAFVLNADSTQLISACEDKTARLWKVAADAPVRNLPHPNIVDSVAFNTDGSMLATGGHDGTVKVFDTVKGAQVRSINAHTQPQAAPVYSVAWSADGKQIASGSMDRTAKLWDASNGNLIREFKGFDEKMSPKGHRDGVFTVALSADGKFLVTGSSDRSLKVWNTADGSVIREFVNPNLPQPKPLTDPKQPAPPGQPPQAHPGWIYHLRFAANGSQIVSVGSAPRNRGYVAVWNFADGKLLGAAELPLGPIYHVALTPDGNAAALACGPRARQKPVSDAVLLKLPGK